MKYKNFYADVHYSDEDKIFYGKIIGIQALVSFEGHSVATLEKAFHEAVNDYLDFCNKLGKVPEKTHSGNITLRVNPEEHVLLSLAAKKASMSLNKFISESAKIKAGQILETYQGGGLQIQTEDLLLKKVERLSELVQSMTENTKTTKTTITEP
jgi:predicted HicB family RNase H-like nuclease